jgi:hypothetical protein
MNFFFWFQNLIFFFIRFRCFLRGFWRWVLNCSLNFSQIWNFGFWWCFEFEFLFSILGGLFLNYFSCFWNSFKKKNLKIWNLGGLFFVFWLKTVIYGNGTGWFFPFDSLLKCFLNSLAYFVVIPLFLFAKIDFFFSYMYFASFDTLIKWCDFGNVVKVEFLWWVLTEVLNIIRVGKYSPQLVQLSKLQLESKYPKNQKKQKKEFFLIFGLYYISNSGVEDRLALRRVLYFYY